MNLNLTIMLYILSWAQLVLVTCTNPHVCIIITVIKQCTSLTFLLYMKGTARSVFFFIFYFLCIFRSNFIGALQMLANLAAL